MCDPTFISIVIFSIANIFSSNICTCECMCVTQFCPDCLCIGMYVCHSVMCVCVCSSPVEEASHVSRHSRY